MCPSCVSDDILLAGVSKIQQKLQKVHSIALTTDAATTISNFSVQGVTAHFMDDDWRIVSISLGSPPLEAQHTGENIALTVGALLAAFDIKNDISCLTSDGAAAQLKSNDILEAAHIIDDSFRCICHTLQLAVTHALDLPQAAQILQKVRDAISLIRGNRTFHDFFLEKQREHIVEQDLLALEGNPIDRDDPEFLSNPLKLFIEVCTRWSSTHKMLNRYLVSRPYIEQTLTQFSHAEKILTAQELQDVKDLMRLLNPFAKAIRIMEGEKYPTLSSYIPCVLGLAAFVAGDTNVKWDNISPTVDAVRRQLLAELVVPGTVFFSNLRCLLIS